MLQILKYAMSKLAWKHVKLYKSACACMCTAASQGLTILLIGSCISLAFIAMKDLVGNDSAARPRQVIFFAQYPNDMEKIRSSIEYSFDKYRAELTTAMKSMDSICKALDIVDGQIPHLKAIHARWKDEIVRIPEYYERNENFTRMLISDPDFHLVMAVSDDVSHPGFSGLANPASYDSVAQLLTHIGRDWSDMGVDVREMLYKNGISRTLHRHVPRDSSAAVLVPGAGLGRLAVELAVDGYKVEANECSGMMVSAMYTIFNKILRRTDQRNMDPASCIKCRDDELDSFAFYPRLTYQMSDEWDFKNRFAAQLLPSGGSVEHIIAWISNSAKPGQLNIQMGDFSVLYSGSDKRGRFDAVVTSFFIDTAAESVLVYLSNIYSVLKPGGVWLNAGPLHYHKSANVPYSHMYLESIILASGFDYISSEIVSTDYCGEDGVTMRPEMYRIPISLYRKKIEEVNDTLLDVGKIERILHNLKMQGSRDFESSGVDDMHTMTRRLKDTIYSTTSSEEK